MFHERKLFPNKKFSSIKKNAIKQQKIKIVVLPKRQSVMDLEHLNRNVIYRAPVQVKQTKKTNASKPRSVAIDFDKASEEWRKNKKKIGQDMYYLCGYVTKRGTPCTRLRTSCHYHNSK
jgi:hypothetical protein